MAGARTIETKAIISAEDKTGGAFASVVQRMAKMEEAARHASSRLKFADAAERQARTNTNNDQRKIQQQERLARREAAMETRQRRLEEKQSRREEIEHLREVRKLQMEKEHHGVRRYVAQAAATAVAAHSIIDVGKETLAAGAERQHVRVGMANAGMKPEEIARAERAAIGYTKSAPNVSISEAMELHKEARSAVQHPEEAFELMPDLAKAASILKGMGAQNAHIADIVKAGETLGLMNDPHRFHKYLDSQVRAMNVMGKTVTTEQIYEAAKYSKSAGAVLDDEFLNLTLPSLIQDLHGSSAGEALSGLTQAFRGGLQHKHLPVEKLNELGLLEDPSKIRRSKTGQIQGYAGKVTGDALLASNPQKWFEQVFNPAAEAHGYKTMSDKVKLLSEVLTRVPANLGRLFLQQEETFRQHRENYQNAPGLEAASENQLKDASVAVGNLTKSLNDLGAAVTGPAMESIGTTLSSVAGGIRLLAAAAHDHPMAAMTGGGIVAGGALVGSGYLAYRLATGFGLTTSAAALDASAAALTGAAVKLAGGHALDKAGAPGGGAAGGKPVDLGGRTLLAALGLTGLILNMPEVNGPDKNAKTTAQRFDEWAAKEFPWLPTSSNSGPGKPLLSGKWNQGRFEPAANGYTRDYSLGSDNHFTKGPGKIVPPSGFAYMSEHELRNVGRTQDVAVKFEQPPPIKIEFSVTASSSLLQLERTAKEATVQLKARADTGPGGLGGTTTSQ